MRRVGRHHELAADRHRLRRHPRHRRWLRQDRHRRRQRHQDSGKPRLDQHGEPSGGQRRLQPLRPNRRRRGRIDERPRRPEQARSRVGGLRLFWKECEGSSSCYRSADVNQDGKAEYFGIDENKGVRFWWHGGPQGAGWSPMGPGFDQAGLGQPCRKPHVATSSRPQARTSRQQGPARTASRSSRPHSPATSPTTSSMRACWSSRMRRWPRTPRRAIAVASCYRRRSTMTATGRGTR